MNRDLPELGLEFEKLERFNLEAATGGALFKRRCSWKNSKIYRKRPLLESLFYRKESPTQVLSCEFLEILNNSFFYRTPLGDRFY